MRSTTPRGLRLQTSRSPRSFYYVRGIHSTQGHGNQTSTAPLSSNAHPNQLHKPLASAHKEPPLSVLPLTSVLRTLSITSISSSPTLLNACTSLLLRMPRSKSFLFDVERNPVVRTLLYQTFYKQFCIGGTRSELQKSMQHMRKHGYSDVILEYALEVLKGGEDDVEAAVERWRKGMLETVELTNSGSFVGLKSVPSNTYCT